jgi:tetratricopeptide (TPR) repeat protein
MGIELFSWICESADFAKAEQKVNREGKRILMRKGIVAVGAVAAMFSLPGLIQPSIAQNDRFEDEASNAARSHLVGGLDLAKTREKELKQLIVQAEASAKSQKWQEAKEQFVLACTKDPSNKNVLHALALVYEHEGLLGQAAVCESKALRLDENFEQAQLELAHIHKLINPTVVEEHLKIGYQINPDNTGEIPKSTD